MDIIESFINDKKLDIYLRGDFNMNLLSYYHHHKIKYFIDSFVMLSLYPCINQPTRFKTATATPMDNIFATIMSGISRCGIIINDATDHLPNFLLSSKYACKNENINYLFLGKHDELSMEKFMHQLNDENWNSVCREYNANIANSNFMKIFSKHYNENCPIQQIVSWNIKKHNPWVTSGLKHACRNKKCIYMEFLIDITLCDEQQYKT